ncbi:MAG: formylglycine-generating enzyme family protein [Verrucomicrobiia bacterium]
MNFALRLIVTAIGLAAYSATGQTPASFAIQTFAELTITGAVGTVYSVEYVTELAQTNNSSAWRCLELLQPPASPYLWADKSGPVTEKRFYRAVAMEPPTNMVFIPPGTFRMGSPTNEVDRRDWEGPQTDVTISRGFWMGKYEVTQAEYVAVMGNNPSPSPFTGETNRPVVGGHLVRRHELLRPAYAAGAGRGTDSDQLRLPTADGGGVGVWVSGGDDDAD